MRTALGRALPVVVLLAWPSLPWAARALAGELHAGIEVGGRGVKVTVIDALATKEGHVYKRLLADTYNTNLSVLRDGAFQKAEIEAAAGAIARFYKTAREKYKVPADHVHLVGSSGLPKASNWDDFVAAVKKATGKQIHFIDDKTEVALSIAGIVPKTYRDLALLLDIGGGNTKGGFLAEGGALAYFSVPFGAVTYAARVRREADADKAPFAATADRLRDELLVKPLKAGARDLPGLGRRKWAYLSGGTVWAMVTLLHPEEVDKPYVPFKAADIDAYRALLLKASGKFPAVDVSKIADPGRRERARKEIAAVQKVYTPERLLAGAEVLRALAVAFELKERNLVFPRHAQVGWLTAYVVGEGPGMKRPPR
jgi:hypothetical protein